MSSDSLNVTDLTKFLEKAKIIGQIKSTSVEEKNLFQWKYFQGYGTKDEQILADLIDKSPAPIYVVHLYGKLVICLNDPDLFDKLGKFKSDYHRLTYLKKTLRPKYVYATFYLYICIQREIAAMKKVIDEEVIEEFSLETVRYSLNRSDINPPFILNNKQRQLYEWFDETLDVNERETLTSLCQNKFGQKEDCTKFFLDTTIQFQGYIDMVNAKGYWCLVKQEKQCVWEVTDSCISIDNYKQVQESLTYFGKHSSVLVKDDVVREKLKESSVFYYALQYLPMFFTERYLPILRELENQRVMANIRNLEVGSLEHVTAVARWMQLNNIPPMIANTKTIVSGGVASSAWIVDKVFGVFNKGTTWMTKLCYNEIVTETEIPAITQKNFKYLLVKKDQIIDGVAYEKNMWARFPLPDTILKQAETTQVITYENWLFNMITSFLNVEIHEADLAIVSMAFKLFSAYQAYQFFFQQQEENQMVVYSTLKEVGKEYRVFDQKMIALYKDFIKKNKDNIIGYNQKKTKQIENQNKKIMSLDKQIEEKKKEKETISKTVRSKQYLLLSASKNNLNMDVLNMDVSNIDVSKIEAEIKTLEVKDHEISRALYSLNEKKVSEIKATESLVSKEPGLSDKMYELFETNLRKPGGKEFIRIMSLVPSIVSDQSPTALSSLVMFLPAAVLSYFHKNQPKPTKDFYSKVYQLCMEVPAKDLKASDLELLKLFDKGHEQFWFENSQGVHEKTEFAQSIKDEWEKNKLEKNKLEKNKLDVKLLNQLKNKTRDYLVELGETMLKNSELLGPTFNLKSGDFIFTKEELTLLDRTFTPQEMKFIS